MGHRLAGGPRKAALRQRRVEVQQTAHRQLPWVPADAHGENLPVRVASDEPSRWHDAPPRTRTRSVKRTVRSTTVPTKNQELVTWVEEAASLTQPEEVVWC